MVTFPRPTAGMVIRYDYVWLREHVSGQHQGNKDRPCVVVLTLPGENTRCIVLPITHAPPEHPEDGLLVPPPVKTRLRLDNAPSWIILTEANSFEWPGPDLRPIVPGHPETAVYGLLPEIMIKEIRRLVVDRARANAIRVIGRTAT